jgi:hypothetical protein
MLDLVITFFLGYLLYKIYRGRPWARVLWTLLFIFGFLVTLSSTFDYAKYPVVLAFIGAVITVAEIIALVLLWHPATTHWVKAMKAARLAAQQSTSAETAESTENVNNSLQTATDSTLSLSESIHCRISYNKLLKVLRVIRGIYVLSVTLICINIASFYGLVVNYIDRFSMSQNTATFANVDRSVMASLLVMFIISLAYIIIENLIDKKLQYFPQELIDRSYSRKAILFLSFLYVYSFFSLNNRILISFCYMNVNKKPGIVPLIYLALSDSAIIYFVFKYLIKKIENKKTWKYFWIFAPFIILFIGATENLLYRLGMTLFADPFIFIMNTLKSIFGATS